MTEASRQADPTYDAFLSYSSSDVEHAIRIQRFIEGYKHPKGMFGPSRLRLKVFRDKTDQGLTVDFHAAFHNQIKASPSFLLLGSKRSAASVHVQKECEDFIARDSGSIHLLLLEGAPESAFPEFVLTRYPRAIHADLRMMNWLGSPRSYLNARRSFQEEMLRVIASLLARKCGFPVSFEDLSLREARRRRQRNAWIAGAAAILMTASTLHYLSTPAFGLHFTDLGQTTVERIVPGHPAVPQADLLAVISARQFWSDQAGQEGHDLAFDIVELTSHGSERGRLIAKVNDTAELIGNPEATGSVIPLKARGDQAVKQFLADLGITLEGVESANRELMPGSNQSILWKTDCKANQAKTYLRHAFDDQQAVLVCGNDHTPPAFIYATADGGKAWKQVAELGFHLKGAFIRPAEKAPGVAYVAAPGDIDPHYPSRGGVMLTRSAGQSWTPVNSPTSDWESLTELAALPEDQGALAVAMKVPARSGDAAKAGVWLSHDGGATWQAAGLQGTQSKVSQLIMLGRDALAIAADDKLMIYRERSFVDRFLMRFHSPFGVSAGKPDPNCRPERPDGIPSVQGVRQSG